MAASQTASPGKPRRRTTKTWAQPALKILDAPTPQLLIERPTREGMVKDPVLTFENLKLQEVQKQGDAQRHQI